MSTNIGYPSAIITTAKSICRGDRFPADVIENAVWLSIRFPLGLRRVEDLLAARRIMVRHEAVRRWAETCGRIDASKIRRRAPQFGDTWHRGAVVIAINGRTQCHVRAIDADGLVPGALVQGREGRRAAGKLGRKLIRKPSRAPRRWSPTSPVLMARPGPGWA